MTFETMEQERLPSFHIKSGMGGGRENLGLFLIECERV